MQRLQRIFVVGLSLSLLAGLGLSSSALAQSANKQKKQLQEYSKQLDGLAEKDKWEISKADRQRARQWLSQAKELLAQGDTTTANWLLTRTGEMVQLIRLTVRGRELEAMGDEREETYHKMKEERIPQLKSDVQELRKQKQKLENELGNLEEG